MHFTLAGRKRDVPAQQIHTVGCLLGLSVLERQEASGTYSHSGTKVRGELADTEIAFGGPILFPILLTDDSQLT